MRVTAIWRHPVRSMAGARLSEADGMPRVRVPSRTTEMRTQATTERRMPKTPV
jgi:uncharacterized protein YcbX